MLGMADGVVSTVTEATSSFRVQSTTRTTAALALVVAHVVGKVGSDEGGPLGEMGVCLVPWHGSGYLRRTI